MSEPAPPQSGDSVENASAPQVLHPYADRRWCALHTRARHEKKVAAACDALHVPAYLPLRISRTFSGGKVNTFHVPMFAGYVFAALAPGEAGELKRTNSVAARIEARDETSLLRDLHNVHRVELAEVELEISPTFRKGQRVLVAQGPLAGVSGVVLRYKNRTRVQVSVEAIGQAVLLDVAAEHLIPVHA